MVPAATPQPIERLPPELLEKVFKYVSVPDILRVKQVNRCLHDFTQESPYLKYRVDLFASGLEDNPAANLSLANKRKAFDEYRAKWDNFSPVQTWERKIEDFSPGTLVIGPGIFGFVAGQERSVQFWTLVSQGAPRKEWKISLPGLSSRALAINPHADVLAVIERAETGYLIHIRSMTTGMPHPAAEIQTFGWRDTKRLTRVYSTSITGSRLAIIVGLTYLSSVFAMAVWDWKTGKTLLELTDRSYRSLTFADEYSLVVLSDSLQMDTPQLHVFDTERGTTLKAIQTSFFLPEGPIIGGALRLSAEPYSYTPSPDEPAPFHSDPSQRILAFSADEYGWYVINTELLLELARERKGQNIEWDEWRADVVQTQLGGGPVDCVWASGCRLFCARCTMDSEGGSWSHLDIYDLSRAGRATKIHALDSSGTDRGVRQISPSLNRYALPWFPGDLESAAQTAAHDGIVFCVNEAQLTDTPSRTLSVWGL